jgi:hypothetical protein
MEGRRAKEGAIIPVQFEHFPQRLMFWRLGSQGGGVEVGGLLKVGLMEGSDSTLTRD